MESEKKKKPAATIPWSAISDYNQRIFCMHRKIHMAFVDQLKSTGWNEVFVEGLHINMI